MKLEDWRKYGEIQYLKGRLDELFKINAVVDMDLTSGRILDQRIEKYFNKLSTLDPIAFELYRVERQNVHHDKKRNAEDESQPEGMTHVKF